MPLERDQRPDCWTQKRNKASLFHFFVKFTLQSSLPGPPLSILVPYSSIPSSWTQWHNNLINNFSFQSDIKYEVFNSQLMSRDELKKIWSVAVLHTLKDLVSKCSKLFSTKIIVLTCVLQTSFQKSFLKFPLLCLPSFILRLSTAASSESLQSRFVRNCSEIVANSSPLWPQQTQTVKLN